MERFNLALATKRIYDSGLKIFTLGVLRDILEIEKESTFFSVIRRLAKNKVLEKVEKNKYLLEGTKVEDFVLANFLFAPSYLSFETALNFFGILSQFPYEVTSATLKKTASKKVKGKIFTYIHLQKSLYWGYEKREGFLIAEPEKALLDQLYLVAKGLRKASWEEYDLSELKRQKFKDYLQKFPQTRQFLSLIKRVDL